MAKIRTVLQIHKAYVGRGHHDRSWKNHDRSRPNRYQLDDLTSRWHGNILTAQALYGTQGTWDVNETVLGFQTRSEKACSDTILERKKEYVCTPENLDPSPIQDEYAPVIVSQETVSHIVSIDIMSGKEDRENILRARASGKGVLTSPFKLLKSNHLGVVLIFAIYNTDLPPDATPEQCINATVGYLGASYDFPSLVEKLLRQLASKQTTAMNVYDTTNKSAPINMYGSNVTDTGLLHISSLDFGDPTRKHEMHCRFKQVQPPPWTAIATSVGVIVITLLLGHIFHAAINQIAKVEHDYLEMMALKHRAEAADIAKSQVHFYVG
ncbi:hypothetical protein LguiA_016857 [Lonicera macranthoides]